MKAKIITTFDYILIGCVILLVTLGIMFIYSSGINQNGILVKKEYLRQIMWAIVGLVIMVLVAFIDYRKYNRYLKYVYAAVIVVLVLTRILARDINGARSWIGIGGLGIQPSEPSKIIFILFLAYYLERSQNEKPLRRFIYATVIMIVPMGLILIQPDMGTASVYLAVFLFMCFIAGIPVRYLMIVLATGLLSIVFAVLPDWETVIFKRSIAVISVLTNIKLRIIVIIASLAITVIGILGQIFFKKRYYYWITYVAAIFAVALVASLGADKVLKAYQKERLIIFLDPYSKPEGSGYHLIQSLIAIGAGGFSGRGFLNGTQSHYRFLPQQSTDFIFSIISEEFGFIGGVTVFALYLIIIFRIVKIMRNATSVYALYICAGILGMFLYHFMVNVGMVMGIMPITGIPLPFLSYGGSALVTNMIAVGLLLSINARRLDFAVAV